MAVPEATEKETEKSSFSLTTFFSETKVELKKVTWPTKQELISNTVVVLIATLLCAGLIWIIDTCFSVIFRLILR